MKYISFIALFIVTLVLSGVIFTASNTKATPIEQSPPLRTLAQDTEMLIGTGVSLNLLETDPIYKKMVAREFNLITPENEFKFAITHPKRDRYNFTQADKIVAFAKANNQAVRGQTLVWHYAVPDWVREGDYTREQLMAILREHIHTVVGRYRGQILAWDVVNEAFEADSSMRDTMWLRGIGPEYIDLAFQWAHEADPQAKLFYNDYSNEDTGQKSEAVYNLVAGMLQRGIPINGVGFQMHKSLAFSPKPSEVAENMNRLAQLGLEVHFTEVDVRIQDVGGAMNKRLAEQARLYTEAVQLCLSAAKCTAFVIWGFTDRYSWMESLTGNADAPLVFDNYYRPKPAYSALIKELKRHILCLQMSDCRIK